MKAFPLLQTEVNRITVEHIRNQEQKCKEHVEFMINYELAYINTNHEVRTKKLNKWFKGSLRILSVSRMLVIQIHRRKKLELKIKSSVEATLG